MKANILENKLIQLQGKIETIKEVEKAKGENFNLFSILGMERLEVKTHSAFIYELINSKGSHNQGDKYLRLFVQNVLKEKGFEHEDVVVKREDSYSDEGRIDFTIENKEMYIAIEMKIDAPDQQNQLKRYIKIAKSKNENYKVYYLTLDGRDSNEDSDSNSNKSQKENKEYENISFSLDILNWIELCIDRSARLPILRENLVQYANVIKKITGQTTEEIIMETMGIIDNPEIAEAATLMSQNIGLIWARREAMFWAELIRDIQPKLNELEWKLRIVEPWHNIFYNSDNEEKLKGTNKIAEGINGHRKKQNNDIELQFYKEINEYEIIFRLYQFNGHDDLMFYFDQIDDMSDENFDTLASKLKLTKKVESDRFGKANLGINFYGHRADNGELTYDLFNDEKLKQLVKKTEKDVLDKLENIDSFLEQINKRSQ